LQHKLASETQTEDELAAAQGSGEKPNAVNRFIALEPAGDTKPEPDVAGAIPRSLRPMPLKVRRQKRCRPLRLRYPKG